jgi:dipeptidyl aminopeptidase/acylaminoacyl peptidase
VIKSLSDPEGSKEAVAMKKFLWIALGFIVLLGIVYLAVGYVIYDRLSLVVPYEDEDFSNTPAKFTVAYDNFAAFDTTPYLMPKYEEVTFPSREPGINLSGWYVEAHPNAPVVILTHGIGAAKLAANVLLPAGMLYRNGFNVLLYDMRNHGISPKYNGGRTSVGNKEYLDVLGAWDYLVTKRGYHPQDIGLFGLSLGGASTLNAFAAEPRVACVLVDSPFSNLQKIITEELVRTGYPGFLASGAIFAGRMIDGVNLMERGPKDAILKSEGRPLFIIHGMQDKRVAVHHTQELVALAKETGANIGVWYVPDADHVESEWLHTAEYEQKLISFYQSVLVPED